MDDWVLVFKFTKDKYSHAMYLFKAYYSFYKIVLPFGSDALSSFISFLHVLTKPEIRLILLHELKLGRTQLEM